METVIYQPKIVVLGNGFLGNAFSRDFIYNTKGDDLPKRFDVYGTGQGIVNNVNGKYQYD